MPKVRIMFSGNIGEIGKLRTVSEEDAATMVREGRAQRVAEPPAEQPEPAVAPAPAKPSPTKS